MFVNNPIRSVSSVNGVYSSLARVSPLTVGTTTEYESASLRGTPSQRTNQQTAFYAFKLRVPSGRYKHVEYPPSSCSTTSAEALSTVCINGNSQYADTGPKGSVVCLVRQSSSVDKIVNQNCLRICLNHSNLFLNFVTSHVKRNYSGSVVKRSIEECVDS
jgi:hypothetical protein